MKIAVLIVGEYRSFTECRRTMEFLDQKNVDIYFSTWSTTIVENPIARIGNYQYKTRQVSLTEIKEAIGREAVIKIHNINNLDEVKPIMIQSWLKGMALVKESKIKYDYMLFMRPDLFFEDGSTFQFKDIKRYNKKIGVQEPSLDGGLDDTLIFSSYENIKKIITNELYNVCALDGGWHNNWRSHIRKEGLRLTRPPFTAKYTIARYPMLEKDTYETVLSRWVSWFNRAHHIDKPINKNLEKS